MRAKGVRSTRDAPSRPRGALRGRRQEKRRQKGGLEGSPPSVCRKRVVPMSLQDELKVRYRDRDIKSGSEFLALVLMEEVGALAEAIRRKDETWAGEELA